MPKGTKKYRDDKIGNVASPDTGSIIVIFIYLAGVRMSEKTTARRYACALNPSWPP